MFKYEQFSRINTSIVGPGFLVGFRGKFSEQEDFNRR